MATVGLCGLMPLLYRRKSYACESMRGSPTPKKHSKAQNEGKRESMQWSFVGGDQLILMMKVHKKILVFRDIMDLAPLNSSASLCEMVITTLEDLQRLYPVIIPRNKVSKIKDKSIDQVLANFCEVLKSIGESWMKNDCMDSNNYELPSCKDNSNMRQLGENMLATLDCLIKIANEKFDIMEEDDQKKEFSLRSRSFGEVISGTSSFSDSSFSCGSSPITPKSVLPEPMKYTARAGDRPRSSCTSPLRPLRIQAVGKLNPIDLKRLSFHMSPPHMKTQNNKIEEEAKPTRDTEMDHKAINAGKDTLENLVFDLDATVESNRTTGDHEKPEKPQPMEVELSVSPRPPQPQSPKPLETPTLLQKAPGHVSSSPSPPPPPPPLPPLPTPSMRLTNTVPPPSPLPTPHVLQPSMSMPPPPPSAPKLQQSAVAVRMPPPPLSHGSNSAAPPSMPLKAGSVPPPPPPLSLKVGSVPPPPPPLSLKAGSAPAPPPPMPRGNGASAPPPPSLGAGRSLRPKATTKLKRSTQLGNLYRTLKGKVEGSSLKCKSSGGRRSAIGAASTGGKQGMADALAEMAKRSSYFQQIEEDVQKYTKQIVEMRSALTNFKTNDMTELIKFHKAVESVLENLTDESQVLSRFEGFPTKKLEAIRMAAALYNKLDSILTELQNWNIVTPVGQLLDKAERYFNKIKTEIDALERTKDEESKKFKSHNIEFDFYILIKIKEAMVDVSSNCMELALKERRSHAAKKDSGANSDGKKKECGKLLWRAFQFAFRVYTFAGGHDDRADMLTRELAKEIESDPNHP